MDEKNEKLQTPEEIPTQETQQEQPTMEQAQTPAPEAPEAEQAPAQEKSPVQEETPAKEEAPAQEEAPPKQEPAASQPPKRMAIDQTQAFKPVRQAAKAVSDATVVIPASVKEAAQDAAQAPQKPTEVSYFDGSTWAYLGWMALAALITLVTLGIGLAWAQCMVWRYRAKHTVVCGRRLTFDGTGLQLFENYLVWGTFTVFTLGIFGLWVPFKVRSWYCGHLYMTGFRRRHSQTKAPTWRSILVLLAAVLCFAALLIGIILIATGNAPWQDNRGSIQPPPPSSTMGETAPPITTPAPTTPPVTTPEPTTTPLYTTPEPTQPKTYTVAVRQDSVLYLRANPSTTAKKLANIPGGTVVTVEEWAGSWAKVTYNGKTGWVSGDFLKEN